MAEWDIPNWVALVIELSIGIPTAVGLSIFFYKRQKKQSDEIEKISKKQNKMIEENYERERNRKILFGKQVLDQVNTIIISHQTLRTLILDYIKDKSEQNKSRIIGFSKNMIESTEGYHIPFIKRRIANLAELFSDPFLSIQIDSLSNSFAAMFKDMAENFVFSADYDLEEKTKVIEEYITSLQELRDKLEKEIPAEKS